MSSLSLYISYSFNPSLLFRAPLPFTPVSLYLLTPTFLSFSKFLALSIFFYLSLFLSPSLHVFFLLEKYFPPLSGTFTNDHVPKRLLLLLSNNSKRWKIPRAKREGTRGQHTAHIRTNLNACHLSSLFMF